jgi:hypothetical protein
MSKDVNKTIPWEKTVVKIEELSGIPRKQIDDVANQIVLGIEATVRENQPKRDGEEISIETPFGGYTLIRYPAQNVQTQNGQQVVRPTCIGVNFTLPRNFVTKANIGLIDKATDEAADADAKKKKTA